MNQLQSSRLSTINHHVTQRPHLCLLVSFVVWKLLLFIIVFVTPSPAYDTSTTILLRSRDPSQKTTENTLFSALLASAAGKLTRWDALYYVKVAERGYANEQEWAFSWGYTQLVNQVARALSIGFPSLNSSYGPIPEIAAALVISNLSNGVATLILYELTMVTHGSHPKAQKLAFISAMLHIISPAGIFLSAPYSESLFSMLAFAGYYLFSLAHRKILENQHFSGQLLALMSAMLFGMACLVRSNGVLNGLLFFVDFIIEICGCWQNPRLSKFVRIFVLGIGGLVIASGVVVPQIVAWQQFCNTGSPISPQWCARSVPSVYAWVQDRYWNVGLFRYWTLSNVPLFILAAPTIGILVTSGVSPFSKFRTVSGRTTSSYDLNLRLAVPQIVLAVMAVTNYHVQVITRLCSGCVVWYWWIAQGVLGDGERGIDSGPDYAKAMWIVRWMVMYALIQAVLYAGFLPPA